MLVIHATHEILVTLAKLVIHAILVKYASLAKEELVARMKKDKKEKLGLPAITIIDLLGSIPNYCRNAKNALSFLSLFYLYLA